MKTIELSDKTYADLLELKNHISMKIHPLPPHLAQRIKSSEKRKVDWEPTYTFDKCLSEIISMIWHEQTTGEIDSIT